MGHNAIRRSATAAAVLAGAGAITWSSVSMPPAPDAAETAPPRVLTVAVTPTANYGQLLTAAAVETLQQSLAALTTDAPALWNTIVADWPDERLTGRNYSRVVDIALLPLVPLVSGPLKHATTGALAAQFPEYATQIQDLSDFSDRVLIRAVGPLVSAIGGAGEAHAGIFRPTTTGDVPAFLEAVVKAPSYVVDGLLFGGYGDIGPLMGRSDWTAPPGLLTPPGEQPRPRNIDGPVETEADSDVERVGEVEPDGDTEPAEKTAQRVAALKRPKATDSATSAAPRDRVRASVREARNSVRDGITRLTVRKNKEKVTTRTDDDSSGTDSSGAPSDESPRSDDE